MRARHRHFNPRNAGAQLVLDARYIAQSNNTAVSTWSDLSGNGLDATQSTSSYQPTLQTSQLGGQPVVRFDGSNDFLTGSRLLTTSNFTAIIVIKASGQDNKSIFAQRQRTANSGRTQFCATSQTSPFKKGRLFFNNGTSYSAISTTDVFDNTPTLFCSESDGSGNSHVRIKNGAKEGTLTGQSWTPENAGMLIGALDYDINQFSGDIGLISLFSTQCTDAMRTRAHHAAAFSFKIDCN